MIKPLFGVTTITIKFANMNDNANKTAQNIEYLHQYELMEHPAREMKNVKILVKDGFPCKCHKVQHAIVQGTIEGQYAKEYEICSTHCTRAQLVKSGDDIFYFQTCEAIPNKLAISNVDAKPKSKLEVLK